MSLTSYFKGAPEARARVNTALARPLPCPATVPLQVEPRSRRYGLIGTAFDYLMRSLLVRTHAGQPLVHTGSPCLALHSTPEFVGAPGRLETLQAAHAARVAGAPLSPEVARACLVLASFDVVLRVNGYHHLAGVVQDEDVPELLELAAAVPLGEFQVRERLLLHPLFPAGGRVFGADADLIDDLLIDVKTTLKLSLRGESLHQLCGRLALERLDGLTGGGDAPIRRLGIYFARHGVLHVWSVDELFLPGALPALVSWLDDDWPRFGVTTAQRTARRRVVGEREAQDDPWHIVPGLAPIPAPGLEEPQWHRHALRERLLPAPIRSVLVARSAARALLGGTATDDDAHLIAGLLGACPASQAPLTFLQACLGDVELAQKILNASRYLNVWYQTKTGDLDKRCPALLTLVQATLAAPLPEEDAAVLARLLPVAAPLADHLEPTRAVRAAVDRLQARGLVLKDGKNVQRLDEAGCCALFKPADP